MEIYQAGGDFAPIYTIKLATILQISKGYNGIFFVVTANQNSGIHLTTTVHHISLFMIQHIQHENSSQIKFS